MIVGPTFVSRSPLNAGPPFSCRCDAPPTRPLLRGPGQRFVRNPLRLQHRYMVPLLRLRHLPKQNHNRVRQQTISTRGAATLTDL